VNTSIRATIPAVRVKDPSALANLGQVARADRRTRADAPIIIRRPTAQSGEERQNGEEREVAARDGRLCSTNEYTYMPRCSSDNKIDLKKKIPRKAKKDLWNLILAETAISHCCERVYPIVLRFLFLFFD